MATSPDCDFSKLKRYDQRIKDIVNGYMRQCQLLFSYETSSYFNIPSITAYIATLYYHHNEYFAKYGDKLYVANKPYPIINRIESNHLRNKSISYEEYRFTLNSAFGNVIIKKSESSIYEWVFKINRDK